MEDQTCKLWWCSPGRFRFWVVLWILGAAVVGWYEWGETAPKDFTALIWMPAGSIFKERASEADIDSAVNGLPTNTPVSPVKLTQYKRSFAGNTHTIYHRGDGTVTYKTSQGEWMYTTTVFLAAEEHVSPSASEGCITSVCTKPGTFEVHISRMYMYFFGETLQGAAILALCLSVCYVLFWLVSPVARVESLMTDPEYQLAR